MTWTQPGLARSAGLIRGAGLYPGIAKTQTLHRRQELNGHNSLGIAGHVEKSTCTVCSHGNEVFLIAAGNRSIRSVESCSLHLRSEHTELSASASAEDRCVERVRCAHQFAEWAAIERPFAKTHSRARDHIDDHLRESLRVLVSLARRSWPKAVYRTRSPDGRRNAPSQPISSPAVMTRCALQLLAHANDRRDESCHVAFPVCRAAAVRREPERSFAATPPVRRQ